MVARTIDWFNAFFCVGIQHIPFLAFATCPTDGRAVLRRIVHILKQYNNIHIPKSTSVEINPMLHKLAPSLYSASFLMSGLLFYPKDGR
jgi:hypothetical protein